MQLAIIMKKNFLLKCLAFVDCDCRGQIVFLQTCPCEGKSAVGQNPTAQYFRWATHDLLTQRSRLFQISQVTREACFLWAFLCRTGLSLFSFSPNTFTSLSITISLSHSSLPSHWPTFQLTCLCKPPCAPVTKRGQRGIHRTVLLLGLLLFGDR